MSEVNLSIYDRQILEQIQYNLESVASALEKLVAKEKFYQTDKAVINLAALESVQIHWNDKNKLAFTYPSNECNNGQMHLKTFDTPEQAEAEYKRLAEVMTK